MTMDLGKELVGASEIARRAGVTRQTAYLWARTETFPRPVVVLNAGSVWMWSSVEKWIKATTRK